MKKTKMTRMTKNSREVLATKEPFKKRLLLRAKNTGAWLSLRGTTVTYTELVATKNFDFYVVNITLTPLTFKINLKVACRLFWCVTCTAAVTEVSSSNATMRYATISHFSPEKTSILTAYAANT